MIGAQLIITYNDITLWYQIISFYIEILWYYEYLNQGEDRSTIDLASPDIRGRPTGDYHDDVADDDKEDVDDDNRHMPTITKFHHVESFTAMIMVLDTWWLYS